MSIVIHATPKTPALNASGDIKLEREFCSPSLVAEARLKTVPPIL